MEVKIPPEIEAEIEDAWDREEAALEWQARELLAVSLEKWAQHLRLRLKPHKPERPQRMHSFVELD